MKILMKILMKLLKVSIIKKKIIKQTKSSKIEKDILSELYDENKKVHIKIKKNKSIIGK